MAAAGVDEVAIETFADYFRLLEHGETGMVPESTIEPLDMDALADADVSDDDAAAAIAQTVVIKLNGGLGTSMGMDRAKSLLCVRRGLSFLDIIARQVLHLRQKYDVALPLIFMNSFRTSEGLDGRAGALRGPRRRGAAAGVPAEQGTELLTKELSPVPWPKQPDLERCPPETATSTRRRGAPGRSTR